MIRTLPTLVFVAGCFDERKLTETGNPDLEGAVAVAARSSAPDEVAVDEDAPVRIEAAEVAIERLRLVMGDACDAPGEVEWDVDTPPVLELVGGDSLPFDAKRGDYCRVRLRIDGDGGPTVRVSGTRADGVPFEIRSEQRFEVDVRSRGEPFVLDEAVDHVVLAFDAATWLDPTALAAARVDDGAVTISDSANTSLLGRFESELTRTLDLFEDVDDDGSLGDGEDDAPLATSR